MRSADPPGQSGSGHAPAPSRAYPSEPGPSDLPATGAVTVLALHCGAQAGQRLRWGRASVGRAASPAGSAARGGIGCRRSGRGRGAVGAGSLRWLAGRRARLIDQAGLPRGGRGRNRIRALGRPRPRHRWIRGTRSRRRASSRRRISRRGVPVGRAGDAGGLSGRLPGAVCAAGLAAVSGAPGRRGAGGCGGRGRQPSVVLVEVGPGSSSAWALASCGRRERVHRDQPARRRRCQQGQDHPPGRHQPGGRGRWRIFGPRCGGGAGRPGRGRVGSRPVRSGLVGEGGPARRGPSAAPSG